MDKNPPIYAVNSVRTELAARFFSDTRAEGGGKPSPVTPVSEWSYVIVGILRCGMPTLLSNEVQVDLVSKDSPAPSLWNKGEIHVSGTSPNTIAFNPKLSPAANEASTVRTFLLQSPFLL